MLRRSAHPHRIGTFGAATRATRTTSLSGGCPSGPPGHAALTVSRRPTLFCNAWRIAKKLAVLGLPPGPSMRCKLLLGFRRLAANCSKPTVALIASRRTAFPVASSPLNKRSPPPSTAPCGTRRPAAHAGRPSPGMPLLMPCPTPWTGRLSRFGGRPLGSFRAADSAKMPQPELRVALLRDRSINHPKSVGNLRAP